MSQNRMLYRVLTFRRYPYSLSQIRHDHSYGQSNTPFSPILHKKVNSQSDVGHLFSLPSWSFTSRVTRGSRVFRVFSGSLSSFFRATFDRVTPILNVFAINLVPPTVMFGSKFTGVILPCEIKFDCIVLHSIKVFIRSDRSENTSSPFLSIVYLVLRMRIIVP